MILRADILMDEENMELHIKGHPGFPYVVKSPPMSNYVSNEVPWHWHYFYEITYLVSGQAEIQTANARVMLHEGEAVFVNANVLHRLNTEGRIELYAHFFDIRLLVGEHNSIYEQKYANAIAGNSNIDLFPIRTNTLSGVRMLELIASSTDLVANEPFGYEFDIRNNLSSFWKMLLEETKQLQLERSDGRYNLDSERLKLMMGYIHSHYGERIMARDIAKAANISERECGRCFQKMLGRAPMKYLQDYRLQMASRMLTQSSSSVIDISNNCGFSSVSYFIKSFREAMDCTPNQYRKRA